jgi:ABC-type sugar transport system substrate-binding protein
MASHRVALFLQDRLNDYQSLLQADCLLSTSRNDMVATCYSANRDTDNQVRQIRAALEASAENRPTAILVSAIQENALEPLMFESAARGIAWVLLSRTVDALNEVRQAYPQIPVFSVIPDHRAIGRIQGQQVRILLRPSDELVYLQGPAGTYSTELRRQGFEQELLNQWDPSELSLHGDWSQESGEQALRDWLESRPRSTGVRVVLAAQNDAMAMGARQALLDWQGSNATVPDEPLRVVGCDGTPTYGQRLVSGGELNGTVIIPSVVSRAIDALGAYFRTSEIPPRELIVGVQSFPDLSELKLQVASSATAPLRT